MKSKQTSKKEELSYRIIRLSDKGERLYFCSSKESGLFGFVSAYTAEKIKDYMPVSFKTIQAACSVFVALGFPLDSCSIVLFGDAVTVSK